MKPFRLQRRLAASVLKCGETRVWMDQSELKEIALATSRKRIKKLVKDGLLRRRQVEVHSRFRTLKV